VAFALFLDISRAGALIWNSNEHCSAAILEEKPYVIPDAALPSPFEFIQSFRRRFVNLHLLWKTTGVPPSVRHTTPTETPITDAELPQELGALIAQYRNTHPDAQISWERHMRAVDGKVVSVVEDERELPSDDAIISVSRTISLNTRDTASIVMDLFVGRIDVTH
jgi:hypothetical protein